MKATVDKNTCIGCGVCSDICPEVFKIGDDGLAEAAVGEVPASAAETAKEAAQQCPVEAIKISD